MCVVSNIGDMGHGMWPKPWGEPDPFRPQFPFNPLTEPKSIPTYVPPYNGPTKEQFEEFIKLMRQAKKLDKVMGVEDCESAAKVRWLKELADYLGCDVSDLVK